MSSQGTLKDECLYCHGGGIELGDLCPWCGEPVSSHDSRLLEVKRGAPALLPEGNCCREFSSQHPHV